ncbi:hypothetical protein MHL31_11625 [Lutibacter sp. A80]|uniref:hypothetical protein n=1 Tax=Lutibacter sp. A80 TaxID=2918453 RepID=UPI001F06517D|nr:hypothetical protein [Lutibacter sp. A80]UMB59724.1 hypothetical protein MHL31_11625 [Lutibacter sp. A80]
MHKKLEAELEHLAHSILELKNNDVTILHKKAQAIYEKLTILKFVEENLNSIGDFEIAEELEKVEKSETVDEVVETVEATEKVKETITTIIEEPEIVKTVESIIEVTKEQEKEQDLTLEQETAFSIEDIPDTPDIPKETSTVISEKTEDPKSATLEEEFKDAISADVATNLFEKATKENPVVEETPVVTEKKRSINDTLFKNNLQIGLNDRIAFVKHLFEGSQEDFNRVLSQLNSFKTETEAKDFLNNFVKPDYNWSDKSEYEQRLIDLIERKFL